MAWTAPSTWADGSLVNAAQLNAQIRDNMAYLKGQAGSPYIESAIELAEQSTPTTPASGRGRVFVGTSGVNNGVASCVDDAGTVYQMARYAESTWTPLLTGSGGGGSYTLGTLFGEYVRTGSMVTVWGRYTVGTLSVAPSGTLRLSGLPFAARSTTSAFYALTIGYTDTSLQTVVRAVIPTGASYVDFYTAAGAQANASLMTAGSYIMIAGSYPL